VSALLDVYPRLDFELVRAEGCVLHGADGRRLLDLYGGHAVTPLGHNHPALRQALARQFAELDFYSNSVVMPVQEAAARAVLGDSEHLGAVQFVNSGTEANEAALHLARRWTGRETVVSFDNSFHGRSLASLAATGLPGYQERLSLPLEGFHRTLPFGGEGLSVIDESVAAVICESVPSIAGVRMAPEGWYPALAERCRQVGALLIFDEVQGGVGRLGTWFGHPQFGVQPDFVTLAKSLGGGFPVGALVVAKHLLDRVQYGEVGTTFGGGPLACAMVEATATTIRGGGYLARVGVIFDRVAAGLRAHGATVRGRGCLIGIETELPAKALRSALLARGMMTGSSGDPTSLRLMPPYVLTDAEIDAFVDAFGDAVAELRA
jgi:acetylornithine/N-succinyldiaminopimelate aminotransferase